MVIRLYKKIVLFFALVFLILNITAAQEEDYNKYAWLKVNLNLSSEVNVISYLDSELDYLSADVMLYPITEKQQELIDIYTYGKDARIDIGKNIVTYLWNTVVNNEEYGYSTYVKTKNVIIPVKEKIKFPLDIDKELLPYIKPGEYIDITAEITKQANEIIENEDDLYVVVFKLADWTRNNIKYNLSTLTAEVTEKSSWVLENKQGVCDELSGLFISMLRSVGVPARFISGSAYTNTMYNFGNHGWAEVYFPGYGWVPFDVTYGQYGWIDPGHIKLAESLDSGEASIKYTWRGSNVDVNVGEIKINASLNSKGETISPLVRLKVIPLANEVGEGSYVPVKVVVENLQPFYLPVTLNVVKAPPNLTEKNSKSLLLKPKQQKSMFWKVKISDKLERGYIYSSIFEVADLFGGIDSAKIKYTKGNKVISEEEANAIIEQNTEKEEKTYSKNLVMDCYSGRNYYYSYEKELTINCYLKNIMGNKINNLKICLGESCSELELGVTGVRNVKFVVSPENRTLFVISARGDSIDLNRYVNVNMLDSPNLRISGINYPNVVSYRNDTNVSFVLNIDAPVVDVRGKLNKKTMFTVDKLEDSERITLILKSGGLYTRNKIAITYKDENGIEYRREDEFYVNLINAPWYIKIIDMFRNLI
ncbi:MAG: transglutaminase domain-containing protein [Nanoarchaeota archaeon]